METLTWVFSGIGVAIIGWLFFRKKGNKKLIQRQKGGKNSKNVQVGGDVKIHKKD